MIELKSRRPVGTDRGEVGQAPLRDEAGQPGQQAEVRRDRRRDRPRRRLGGGDAWPSSATTCSCFCFHDSPRRAHSIAAQGGINAAKNYQNDGDCVQRLFYDTVKGGDFRSREANVYRLAQVSVNIIDQCVAQGVPFAREYGGLLANRSFGGAQVSRTFYARGQTGQQLLLGAYQALERQIALGKVKMYTRTEMLDLVVVDGRARGIVDARPGHRRGRRRTRPTPWCSPPAATATCSSCRTNAKDCNVTAVWRAHKQGAAFANPCYTQIHPTCIPVSGEHQSKLTLMSESLRNDGRVWVPKKQGDNRAAVADSRGRARLLPRAQVPELRQPRAARHRLARGQGGVRRRARRRPRRARRLPRLRRRDQAARAEDASPSATATCSRCTSASPDENPYQLPMRIYPAVHYTMGGLWVDYNLMSTIPGLYVIGEANFSDHGANRLGASALMQGLADGYFVLPYTIGNYLAGLKHETVDATTHPGVRRRRARGQGAGGAAARHQGQAHGRLVPQASSARSCGTSAAWRATREGLTRAIAQIPAAARGVLART